MVTIANFREEQYPATDEVQCIKVYIPAGDEYKQLLAGLLALPARVANFNDPESAQAEGVSDIWRDAYDLTDWGGCGTPPECMSMDSEITIFPGTMTLIAGGAISTVVNTAALYNYISEITPSANANQRQTHRYMEAGEWTYRLTALTRSTGCNMLFQINAANGDIIIPTTFNLRTATTIFNAVFTGTFTLPVRGLTQINFGVSAGSSGGFVDQLQLLEMWRTS